MANRMQELFDQGFPDPIEFGSQLSGANARCHLCAKQIFSQEDSSLCNGYYFHIDCARAYSTFYIVKQNLLNQKIEIDTIKNEQQMHKNRMDNFEWSLVPRLEKAVKEVEEMFHEGGKLLKTLLGREH